MLFTSTDEATRRRPLAAAAVAGVIAFSGVGLAACGDTAGDETGTSVEDIQEGDAPATSPTTAAGTYDGVYDNTFHDGVNDYLGQTVTVSADVNEVVDGNTFTIAGTDDTSVDPLLVTGAKSTSDLEPDLTVKVTGTVQEAFDLATVEDDLGVDLDDDLYDDWDGKPYIVASSVDTSVASDQ